MVLLFSRPAKEGWGGVEATCVIMENVFLPSRPMGPQYVYICYVLSSFGGGMALELSPTHWARGGGGVWEAVAW